MTDYLKFEIIGHTIDDAVGEAFDKCAKVLDLGYPGGPVVDKLAKIGDAERFKFSKPRIEGYNYSFSGVKTSLLYFLRDSVKENPDFIPTYLNDICASFQKTLITILLEKLIKAAKDTEIKEIALAGGVSANSGLRDAMVIEAKKRGWKIFLPELKFTTDNAAMIGITGYYRFINGLVSPIDVAPVSRALDYERI
ncbi:tRNA N6-adenosine threonylcarbamoyltransferase [bioreactor metagenome]|uniref:N(6)-L-threonylcarbamoyladenine synthase n=1 Tax=bioreactor metagenome TaxID=1076179 RepID=A0A645CDK9_9ZZZZ